MNELTPKRVKPKLLAALTIVAGIYMVLCLVLALCGILEWRFALIGFLCVVSLLCTWSHYKENNK